MPQVRPMVISIWCGASKPTALSEYLRPFVNELNDLIENDFTLNGHAIIVKIRCFICDTPARAFIKGIVLMHNFAIYFGHTRFKAIIFIILFEIFSFFRDCKL